MNAFWTWALLATLTYLSWRGLCRLAYVSRIDQPIPYLPVDELSARRARRG